MNIDCYFTTSGTDAMHKVDSTSCEVLPKVLSCGDLSVVRGERRATRHGRRRTCGNEVAVFSFVLSECDKRSELEQFR